MEAPSGQLGGLDVSDRRAALRLSQRSPGSFCFSLPNHSGVKFVREGGRR
jgi:hypothetical protein